MTDEIYASLRPIIAYKHARVVATAFLIFSAIAVGVFGYRWYRTRIQERAQEILSQALDEYTAIRQTPDDKSLKRAEQMFEEAYIRSKQSTLAPLFLMYEADAQALRGQLNEARQTLDRALQELPHHSPFYELYEIKKALVEIDAQCGRDVCDTPPQAALEHLEKIAYNKQARYRALALNYLIDYHSSLGRNANAKKAAAELKKITESQGAHTDMVGSFL